ncbi:hypothetical protein KIL84_004336 [Mauremys mutica]|uniref:Uncharacterized protein n=1 Tax=Mauremys mutica TaxID=74926 RepID=A0A9D3XJX1_9SAUR|nr:hypothetical protein KIL84_004336 [Mauremys mutica]
MSTIKTQSTTGKGNSFGNQKNLTGKGADILLSEINWLYCVALQGLVSALSTRETHLSTGATSTAAVSSPRGVGEPVRLHPFFRRALACRNSSNSLLSTCSTKS